jgi:hypothetical protein
MEDPDLAAVRADVARFWSVSARDEQAAAADAWEALDRATALRRRLARGADWAEARLAEGLARLYITRQVSEWGNRSYALQALEAAIDGLRDAVAERAPGAEPSAADIAAFREALLSEWRAGQSEPGLERFAALSIPALRSAE